MKQKEAAPVEAVIKSEPVRVRRSQHVRRTTARAKLLDAAIELIIELGFMNTTMGDIATRAGMTRGAIQHHFAGRDELVLAILHELEGKIVETFEKTVPKAEHDVPDRVSRLIDALGSLAQSDVYLAIIDVWMATRSEMDLREGVRASMARSFRAYGALWQRNLDGMVPAAIMSDCRRLVVTTMRGVVISRIFIADSHSVSAVIRTVKKMVLTYLAAQTEQGSVTPATRRAKSAQAGE